MVEAQNNKLRAYSDQDDNNKQKETNLNLMPFNGEPERYSWFGAAS